MLGWIFDWCHAMTEYGKRYLYADRVVEIERMMRIPLGGSATNTMLPLGVVGPYLEQLRDDQLLRIADFLCYKLQDEVRNVFQDDPTALDILESILLESGSKWRVGTRGSHPGLVERVPAGVQSTVDTVIDTAGRAGQELAEAWNDIFGLRPDPSDGYRMAVKAVESASIPVVCPKKAEATLGDVIGHMKQHGDWRPPFLREHHDSPTAEVLLGMLRTLWRGHHDRHGGAIELPPEVSKEEAEAAVVLAATLVQWFTSGAVQRRP